MHEVNHPSHDPAPSRAAYRLHRMWLTPLVRLAVLLGMPILIIGGALWWVVDRTEVIPRTVDYFAELKRTIEERPEFTVKLMSIDGAADEISEDIREILPIDFPVSSFDLDLEELRLRIEELDAIASVTMRIRTGGILQVDIVERIPAVVWRGPQGIEMLDSQGHRVASIDRRSTRPDLPLIVGEGAELAVPESLALVAIAQPLGRRFRGLQRVGERRWDLVLDRDQRVMLPEQGAELALEQVIALDQAHDLMSRDILVVDFRNPARPIVRGDQVAVDNLRQISALGGEVKTDE